MRANIIKDIEKEKQKLINKAKETGHDQIIRVLGHYDGDGDRDAEAEFGKECGLITVYEIATPTGEIKETSSAAY